MSPPSEPTSAAPTTGPDARSTLSEHDSKRLLAPYGVPFAPEEMVHSPEEAGEAAERLGFPVAVKLGGEGVAHKSERGLVRLGLGDREGAVRAASELLGAARPEDGDVHLLVAPMVGGLREMICGLISDPQFGPVVMVGFGGVHAEVLGDVCFALAPLQPGDAHRMLESLRLREFFGPFRGEPPIDRDRVAGVLDALGEVARHLPQVVSVDLNPLIIAGGRPVAVDALVEVAGPVAIPGEEAP